VIAVEASLETINAHARQNVEARPDSTETGHDDSRRKGRKLAHIIQWARTSARVDGATGDLQRKLEHGFYSTLTELRNSRV